MATLNGVVLGPNSPAHRLRKCRTEKVEGALCDALVAQLSGREHVVNLSQQRASMLTEGLPDRRYRAFGVAFWWELKAEDGKLTHAQHAFLLAELTSGAPAGCGTLQDLQDLLDVVKAHREPEGVIPRMHASMTIQAHCLALIGRWSAKGYRTESPPRRRRR
jgi:hypothetical protein